MFTSFDWNELKRGGKKKKPCRLQWQTEGHFTRSCCFGFFLSSGSTHWISRSSTALSVNPVVWEMTKCLWFHAELFLTSSSRRFSTNSSSLSHSLYSCAVKTHLGLATKEQTLNPNPEEGIPGRRPCVLADREARSGRGHISYLDDPLSVLPGVVVLSVLAEDVGDEFQLLWRVVEPLHHHSPVMPARGKELNEIPLSGSLFKRWLCNGDFIVFWWRVQVVTFAWRGFKTRK